MGSDRLIHVVRVFLNQRHSVFTRGPCLIKSAPQCSLCHASVSWSVLGAVVVLKARQSWVKIKSWLIPSSTTPRGYYFHPFPDDWAEGVKYRFSGFTPNKQTNKQTERREGGERMNPNADACCIIEGWDLKHCWKRARAQAAREAH